MLDLTEILGDVQSPALNPGVQLLVVQVQVIVDEVDLAQFHNLNGHIERNGDQHLMDTNEGVRRASESGNHLTLTVLLLKTDSYVEGRLLDHYCPQDSPAPPV